MEEIQLTARQNFAALEKISPPENVFIILVLIILVAGLKEMDKLQQLTSLNLWDTKITDAGVAQLKKALPKCEIYH